MLLASVVACSGSSGDDADVPRQVPSLGPSSSATAVAPSSPLAASPAPVAHLEPFASGLDQPIYLTAPAGDPRVFVVQKGGLVRILRGGRPAAQPFLDLTGQVSDGGEQGLLSIAFSPDYARDGRVYVDYTDRRGDTQVVEYRVSASDPDRVDPATRRVVLSVDQPFSNHNGGLLLFDSTGMLLIGLGDGGSAGDPGNRAQDLGQLLGKILRIDPRHGSPYSIPQDNPFRGRAGARPEVWMSGLRNPWRFAFDPGTGALWIGDVGQNHVEEVDAVRAGQQAGRDFEWRVREGDRPYSPGQLDRRRTVAPVAVYDHTHGRCSVTGGLVTGGRYYYGDYCSGEVWMLKADPRSPGRSVRAPFSVESLVSFGTDGAGRAYAVSLSGRVWRVVTG
jgi:glucose/arabinose dehydrogenase